MKKSRCFLLTAFLLLYFFQTAQAAISYTPGLEAYSVDNNGGTFYDLPVSSQNDIIESNVSGTPPSDIRTVHFYDNGSYPSMTLSTAAAGTDGSTPNTQQVSAYAAIDYIGEDNEANRFLPDTVAANVRQGVTAAFQKGFKNMGNTTIRSLLSASLSGAPFINFNSFGDSSVDSFFAEYSVTAHVSVEEYKLSGAGIENVYELTITKDNISDSLPFDIHPHSEGYEYLLLTSLRIDTQIQTFHPFLFDSVGLEGVFNIGTDANPLVLDATIGDPDFGGMPVPVTPSLFLLLSGVAGISFMRLRRDQDTDKS